MTDGFGVTVKLTKKDYRDYYLVENRRRIIIIAIFGIMIILSSTFMLCAGGLKKTLDLVFIIGIILIEIVLAGAALLLLMYLPYALRLFLLRKDPAFEKHALYRFDSRGYKVRTVAGVTVLDWADVLRIKEYKRFFAIRASSRKNDIIPKRCFSSDAHVKAFCQLLMTYDVGRRLRLGNYSFDKFAPDELAVFPEVKEDPEEKNAVDKETDDYLYKFDVMLTKRDLLQVNFRLFYTRPTGIILTLIGLALLYAGIRGFIDDGLSLSPMIFSLFSLIFLVFTPVNIYDQCVKASKKGKKPLTYIFFGDHVIVNNQEKSFTYNYAQLKKAVSLKPAYLLYLTRLRMLIIPKRSDAGGEAFARHMMLIKSEIKKRARRILTS